MSDALVQPQKVYQDDLDRETLERLAEQDGGVEVAPGVWWLGKDHDGRMIVHVDPPRDLRPIRKTP